MGIGDPWAGQARLTEFPILASSEDSLVPDILGTVDPTGSEYMTVKKHELCMFKLLRMLLEFYGVTVSLGSF